MSASEDQADVSKVLAGDISAFEGIVRRWQNPLINLAYRYSRDRGRAEEMAQEAFLRAYRSLGKWRGEAVFSTWLFALAANVYRSELRRIPANTFPLEMADIRKRRAANTAPEDGNRDEDVNRAVAALPPKYREALILYYFQELDVHTAAQSMGLPAGTFKARLFRAREILRRKLEDQ